MGQGGVVDVPWNSQVDVIRIGIPCFVKIDEYAAAARFLPTSMTMTKGNESLVAVQIDEPYSKKLWLSQRISHNLHLRNQGLFTGIMRIITT